jgi:hypothetical protein
MANWVKTKLYFECSQEKAKEIRNFVSDDEGNFDLNRIVPMPEELNIEHSNIGLNGMGFILTDTTQFRPRKRNVSEMISKFERLNNEESEESFIKRFTAKSTEDKKMCITRGRQGLYQILHYRCFDLDLYHRRTPLAEDGIRFLLTRATYPFSFFSTLNNSYIYNFFQLSDADRRKTEELGKKYLFNILYNNYPTFYLWRAESDITFCANSEEDIKMFKNDAHSNHGGWGTKRNSFDTCWTDSNNVEFFNVWCFPYPCISELAKKFPDVKIHFAYADEDWGTNCGSGFMLNDEEEILMPENGSDDAYKLYKEVWNDYHLVKSENGIWQYIDILEEA